MRYPFQKYRRQGGGERGGGGGPRAISLVEPKKENREKRGMGEGREKKNLRRRRGRGRRRRGRRQKRDEGSKRRKKEQKYPKTMEKPRIQFDVFFWTCNFETKKIFFPPGQAL